MTIDAPDFDADLVAAENDKIHPTVVRTTHWLVVLSFFSLLVSGLAILIIHPRLYWGETGAFGMPSLVDLPFEPIRGHTGWGRSLHFLSAWVLVFSGVTYVIAGFVNRHFRERLVPERSKLNLREISRVLADHLRWKKPGNDEVWSYNVVQRLTYLTVVFLLFPAMVWTGLAMSPALMSVFPFMVTVLGGHQSARTIHFIVANLLVLFVVVHLTLLFLVGFRAHVVAMITGKVPSKRAAHD